VLSTPTARRLASRAVGSYLAGAIVFPYERVLADAEAAAYDIDFLRQAYRASFEQVAHRLVTLRRPGQQGIAFGFLRSDPAGRLTKHFPLPGLLLPNSGHACPLWAIYGAFRTPDVPLRQVVRFSDGSRYLFLARTVQRRTAAFREQVVASSVMLACDVLQADRTVYGAGLDLPDLSADVPVGPNCRLCPRRDCASRQEEALSTTAGHSRTRGPLLPSLPLGDPT
jgi:predicted transcriptional regulator